MVSRTAWIGVVLVARLLMVAVLVTTAVRTAANRTGRPYGGDSSPGGPTCVDAACMYAMCRLQRYTMVAAAAIGAAGSTLQIPFAVYLIGKSRRRMAPSALIVNICVWTDVGVTVLLGCAFSVGYATPSYDVLSSSDVDESARRDLIGYYHRAKLPLALLFVGMLLSMAATLNSAKQKLHLRSQATATNADVVV
ncbi:hypothetical protein BS78_04G168400 [Paspalum vaginatum]|nr:hypothetical protein BS78_04G168400 [Paspalum vaginatum]